MGLLGTGSKTARRFLYSWLRSRLIADATSSAVGVVRGTLEVASVVLVVSVVSVVLGVLVEAFR